LPPPSPYDHVRREHFDERLRVAQLRSGEESPSELVALFA
jgi:hypothetical protein